MSLNDFLAELAVKYEALETLYLDIGTPEQQKEEESQTLFEKLLVVLNDHIQQVAQTKDSFTQETDRMWDNMQRMNRLMGQSDEAPTKLIDTLANMTLWDRRSTLQEEYTYVYDVRLGEPTFLLALLDVHLPGHRRSPRLTPDNIYCLVSNTPKSWM